MSDKRTIAVFDYDHTLITHDSFWHFLALVAGWPRTILAFLQSLAAYVAREMGPEREAPQDSIRTFLKAQLIKRVLAGKTVSGLEPAIQKLRAWQKWNEPVHKALLDHHKEGHHILIISGALDLYLPQLVKDLPHHGVVCTDVEVKNDVVAGNMFNGNCVREGKAQRLKTYLQQHGPFEESWGYGNLPHDLPMLELLKHRIIV